MQGHSVYREIHEKALTVAEPLCRRWLPKGVRRGAWWVAPVPWRDDKNPSLGVSLTTGWFRDFATGDKGDLIDLCAKVHNATTAEAAEALAEITGHPYRRSR